MGRKPSGPASDTGAHGRKQGPRSLCEAVSVHDTTQMQAGAARDRRSGTPNFVHDFTAVPVAVEDAVRRLSAPSSGSELEEVVRVAWNSHTKILADLDTAEQSRALTTRVHIELDGHRLRGDTGVINLRWHGDGRLPTLDADLELAAFGPNSTHMHLLGRYELPNCPDTCECAGNMHQRVMVSVVRQFLTDFRNLVARPEPQTRRTR